MASSSKKDQKKTRSFKKGIRGGICYSIYRYARVNNKDMKDYDKNKE